MDITTIVAVTGGVVTVVGTIATPLVYSVRTLGQHEGRLNGHDQRFELEEKNADERHEEVKERLRRIESKIDAQNGKH